MTTPTPTLPTIHFNGSGAERLFKHANEAWFALDTVVGRVAEAAPHARDYYPQGDDAYGKASAEYRTHLAALAAARDFFTAHALHANEALDAALAARLRRPATETVREERVTLGEALDPREQSNTPETLRR
jgi:hypothetical protein